MSNSKTHTKMKSLAPTKENAAKIEALKSLKETYWTGNLYFDTLDKCLTSMNLNTFNSGWYKPEAVRLKALPGIYMVNEDGGLYCEQRIIKLGNEYRVESLTNTGFRALEDKLEELL